MVEILAVLFLPSSLTSPKVTLILLNLIQK